MIELQECLQSISIAGGFTPAQDYHVFITDKFGNVMYKPYTADVEGKISLTLSAYPAGNFMAFSGAYTIQVFEAIAEQPEDSPPCAATPDGDPYTFTFCGEEFDCIIVVFGENEGETTIQTIPVCSEQP